MIALAPPGCRSGIRIFPKHVKTPARGVDPVDHHSVIERLSPGMPAEDVEALLDPLALNVAYTAGSGMGRYWKVYHLPGDEQILLDFGLYGATLEKASKPGKRTRWYGLFWDPTDSDIEQAIRCVRSSLKERISRGEDIYRQFPVSPAGRPIHPLRNVQLTLDAGGATNVALSCWGEYRTHRIIHLDVLRDDQWILRIPVDLDDKKIVPTSWTPKPMEILRARNVADPLIPDFLEGNPEISVEGHGEYDFGPQRRLITLIYRKSGGLTQSLKFVTIDLENGVEWKNPLWADLN